MKKCSKCKINKNESSYSKRKASKDGLSYICKECKCEIDKEYKDNNRDHIKNYMNNYYESNKELIKSKNSKKYHENKDTIKEVFKEYYIKNSENIKEKSNIYYYDNKKDILDKRKYEYNRNSEKYKEKTKKWSEENQEAVKKYRREYYLKNKKRIKEYKKNYYVNNKEYINKYMRDYWANKKYIKSWRGILYRYLKYFSKEKNESTLNLLGYTPEMLRIKIEFQFKSGMSWENYGEWEIDHKKPLSKFDINCNPNIVNALCNLQPLWKIENIKKSNKWK